MINDEGPSITFRINAGNEAAISFETGKKIKIDYDKETYIIRAPDDYFFITNFRAGKN